MNARKPTSPPERLCWSYADLQRVTGLARSTLVKMVSKGELPKPRRVGGRVLFLVNEVRAALEALPAAS